MCQFAQMLDLLGKRSDLVILDPCQDGNEQPARRVDSDSEVVLMDQGDLNFTRALCTSTCALSLGSCFSAMETAFIMITVKVSDASFLLTDSTPYAGV